MTLLDSLLDAIIRLDGDSLVMHVGEKPYVVTSSSSLNSFRGPLAWGQVELSSRPLTPDAVNGMLMQILPEEQRHALNDLGAVEHELPAPDGGDPFLITAARGGDDVWVEVRRKPKPVPQAEPVIVPEPAPFTMPEPEPEIPAPVAEEFVPVMVAPAAKEPTLEELSVVEEASAAEEVEEAPAVEEIPAVEETPSVETPAFEVVAEEPVLEEVADEHYDISAGFPVHEIEMPSTLAWGADTEAFEIVSDETAVPGADTAAEFAEANPTELLAADPAFEIVEEPAAWGEMPLAETPTVVPIAKPALKLQPPPPQVETPAASTESTFVDLLKAAAARGASTVYAVADSRPMIRVDGQIALLGAEAALAGSEIDRFSFEFAPRDHVAEQTPEWTCAVKGVGRVRCVTFHDDSGTGLIVHLPSPNVSTADEIGLEGRVQALCGEADGLVIIAGPRGSGKSTLLDAFVDLINRTRYDHVITIESHIRTAHEKRHSFISQRQSDPDGEAIAFAARAALREGPDVLVIEDLRAPEALSVALDAARAGRLVFGGIAAPTASAAVERLVGAFPGDRRPQVRALLATSMRAVVAQVLVRKSNGGRIGARELLLHSPAVEKLVLDGAYGQLPLAIEGGRRLGMFTMNDALGALVRGGSVEVAEACRVATDRGALIAALARDGVDVSDVERRA